MNRLITSLVIALLALPAWAEEQEERWYEVEIILFENLNPVSTNSERWPLEVEQPDHSTAIELLRSPAEMASEEIEQPPLVDTTVTSEATPIEQPQADVIESKDPYLDTPYLLLPAEQYRLNDAYQKLVESENYLPLVHVAWRQVVPPRERPDRIFIHDKLNEPIVEEQPLDAEVVPSPDTELTPPPSLEFTDTVDAVESLNEDKPEHNLSGILSLGLGRYLHVEADLILYKPQQETAMVAEQPAPPVFVLPEQPPLEFSDFSFESMLTEEPQTPELFRIQGNLRMRSGEVHYLDHPLAGMLILFTPYEPPIPEVIEEVVESVPEQPQSNGSSNTGVVVPPGREPEDRSF